MTQPITTHALARLLLAGDDRQVLIKPVNDSNPLVGTVDWNPHALLVTVHMPKWQIDKREPQSFILYWKNGKHEVVEGADIAEAIGTKYGAGAQAALDFYDSGSEPTYHWDKNKRDWIRNDTPVSEPDEETEGDQDA